MRRAQSKALTFTETTQAPINAYSVPCAVADGQDSML